MAKRLLEIQSLDAHYGDAHVLFGVDLHVDEGAIVALVGANGAGKSTLLKAVSGLITPTAGDIRFRGRSIRGMAAQQIVATGLSHVPEGRGLFTQMTVLENLELGAWPSDPRTHMRASLERVFELFPRLRERVAQKAGSLSGGEQQMLAMGRALMSRPRLILMDEPSMGLAPLFVERIFEIIKQVNERGISVFVVEQNANVALSIADRGYVLQTGEVVLSGPARDLLADEGMKRAYLGET